MADYDLGLVDRSRFAVFLANGHRPVVDGRSIDSSWHADDPDHSLHVGPQCASCGYRHCESCDSAASIPSCDGAVGMARRLRERADVLWRGFMAADKEAAAALERLRALKVASAKAEKTGIAATQAWMWNEDAEHGWVRVLGNGIIERLDLDGDELVVLDRIADGKRWPLEDE